MLATSEAESKNDRAKETYENIVLSSFPLTSITSNIFIAEILI